MSHVALEKNFNPSTLLLPIHVWEHLCFFLGKYRCTFNLSGSAGLNPMVSMWAFHCSSHDCLLVDFSNRFGWISMFPPSMDPVIGLFCGKSPFLNEKHVILPCFMGNENYSNWWRLGPNPGTSWSKKSPPVRSLMFDDTSITEPQQESLVIICPGSIHIPMIGWIGHENLVGGLEHFLFSISY